MAFDPSNNPQSVSRSESKTARKKKPKSDGTDHMSSPVATKPSSDAGAEAGSNGADSSSESPYLRELQKNLRNVTKKLNATQKVDAIIADNPGQSLDELVAARKINADQKAQAQKKPGLQAQLAQLEEQVVQYRKFAQDYQRKFDVEKEQLLSKHKQELEELRQATWAEATAEVSKSFKQRLLTLSRFLRAAAARRQQGEDDSDEGRAFEGALLLVYGGDGNAVTAADKLIDGSNEAVPSTEGDLLNVTYEQVKQAALNEAPVPDEDVSTQGGLQFDTLPADHDRTPLVNTDPTIAHAGLTEMDTAMQVANGTEIADTPTGPTSGTTDAGAANAAAEEKWDAKVPGQDEMSASAESFEMVPRDPAETESGSIPAAITSTQSWADETAEQAPVSQTPAVTGNDGFHEVHHNRGGRGRGGYQGEHRGGYRGRGGPRGEGRGRGGFRGDRGDFRGRGRGGFRGGRGRDGSQ